MIVPDYISKQIFEIRNLLNEVLREVQDDTFDYDEFQIFRLEKYREFSLKIKEKENCKNWLQFRLSTKSVNIHGDNKDDSTELFLKLFHISRYTS